MVQQPDMLKSRKFQIINLEKVFVLYYDSIKRDFYGREENT